MILKLLSSGDTLNKIASMLGMGQEQAGKAVSAAVPTLLAGLAEAASKPGGGAKLANIWENKTKACSTALRPILRGWWCCDRPRFQYAEFAPRLGRLGSNQ